VVDGHVGDYSPQCPTTALSSQDSAPKLWTEQSPEVWRKEVDPARQGIRERLVRRAVEDDFGVIRVRTAVRLEPDATRSPSG